MTPKLKSPNTAHPRLGNGNCNTEQSRRVPLHPKEERTPGEGFEIDYNITEYNWGHYIGHTEEKGGKGDKIQRVRDMDTMVNSWRRRRKE